MCEPVTDQSKKFKTFFALDLPGVTGRFVRMRAMAGGCASRAKARAMPVSSSGGCSRPAARRNARFTSRSSRLLQGSAGFLDSDINL